MGQHKAHQCLTEAEYLAMEEGAQTRHEFVDGYVFAMSGNTQAHQLICDNVQAFLRSKLAGGPCRAVSAGLRVHIAEANSYYYPDVIVECGEFDPKALLASKPVLLVEVLSPSTAQIDRREKLFAYRKISSLNEYLTIFQDRQQVELHRKSADGNWTFTVLQAMDELILESLPTGAVLLPFSAIYHGYDAPRFVKEPEDSMYAFSD
jgi:Uma2 family endonuclease